MLEILLINYFNFRQHGSFEAMRRKGALDQSSEHSKGIISIRSNLGTSLILAIIGPHLNPELKRKEDKILVDSESNNGNSGKLGSVEIL